jgi:hypothetical protein
VEAVRRGVVGGREISEAETERRGVVGGRETSCEERRGVVGADNVSERGVMLALVREKLRESERGARWDVEEEEDEEEEDEEEEDEDEEEKDEEEEEVIGGSLEAE